MPTRHRRPTIVRIRLLASTLLGIALLASIGVGSTLAKGDTETF
jgi:hypothetical protein